MIKLFRITVFLTIITILCVGCSTTQNDNKYNLAICNSNNTNLTEFVFKHNSDGYKVEQCNFQTDSVSEFIKTKLSSSVNSITVYSQYTKKEDIVEIIDIAKSRDIPVIFVAQDISKELLLNYDKAFCVVSDFILAAEKTAQTIKSLWTTGSILDVNGDGIFSYTIIKDTVLSPELRTFNNYLIKNLEIYGVPTFKVNEISTQDLLSLEVLDNIINSNECTVVISENALPFIQETNLNLDTKKVFAIYSGETNVYTPFSSVFSCFIDYNNYKEIVDTIIDNFNKKQNLLRNISMYNADRIIYVPSAV